MDSIPDMVFNGVGEDKIASRLSYAGDVNGDGGDDFMIKISRYHTEKPSAIYIYFGGSLLDTIPDVVLVGESFGDAFGSCFSTAGDVNDDGYNDVMVAAVNYPNETMQGKVYIYLGGPDMDSIPDFVLGEKPLSYNIKANVSIVGDVNGDGYADIICGGWYRDSTDAIIDKAYIFYGGQEVDTIPDVILEDGNVWWGPQGPFSQAGDINRDGYADVIAGNPRGFGDLGAVLVYLGDRTMDGELAVGFSGFFGSYEGCGKSVGRAGDVNGDGIDDILFGAPGLYTPPYENSEGRVMVFSGDTTLNYVREEKGGFELPREIVLKHNYPNPFNAATHIRYTLPAISYQPSAISLKIYNLLGKEVATLVNRRQRGGYYRVTWDGKDGLGKQVGSGIYFYQLRVQGQKGGVAQKTKKMVLIR